MDENAIVKNQDIQLLVKKIAFGEAQIHEGLVTNSVLDSVGLIDLALALEEKYSIKIHGTEIVSANFDSVERLTKFISDKVVGKKDPEK